MAVEKSHIIGKLIIIYKYIEIVEFVSCSQCMLHNLKHTYTVHVLHYMCAFRIRPILQTSSIAISQSSSLDSNEHLVSFLLYSFVRLFVSNSFNRSRSTSNDLRFRQNLKIYTLNRLAPANISLKLHNNCEDRCLTTKQDTYILHVSSY